MKRDTLTGLQSIADGWLVRLGKQNDREHDLPLFRALRMPDSLATRFDELIEKNRNGALSKLEDEYLTLLLELNEELYDVLALASLKVRSWVVCGRTALGHRVGDSRLSMVTRVHNNHELLAHRLVGCAVVTRMMWRAE